MREIIFRGKSGDKWIYGYYLSVKEQNKHYILTGKLASYSIDCSHSNLKTNGFEWFEVAPETVGQYTGLKDKNGNRIFEGDIVRLKIEDDRDYETDGYVEAKICYIIEKEYDNPAYCGFGLQVLESDKWFEKGETFLRQEDLNFDNSLFETEIIGNIHDNKDLIGE